MAAIGDKNMRTLIPQPSQILTVFTNSGSPVDITLDGGATGSFIKHECAKKHNFKIWPNNQSAGLADSKTNVKSIGYIEETFYRDKWCVKFKGLVVENLKADVYGGQPFMIDNDIIQRPAKNIITVHGKYTVMQTNNVMPTKHPNSAAMVTLAKMNLKRNVIYPGNSINIPMTNNLPDQPVAIEIRSNINNAVLPSIQQSPELITITNTCSEPLIIPTDINIADLSTCNTVCVENIKHIPHKKQSKQQPNNDNYKQLDNQINKNMVDSKQLLKLQTIHETYQNVFDGELTGYNGRFGKHNASLQWADETRPKTTRIYPPSWSSTKDVALQRKIDQLTDMGVLADPYLHNVQVKCIHPCFLQKKARAASKNFDDCTMSELRFLTAPNAVNEKCRQIQTTVPDQNKIFQFLGKNRWAIYADLYESFFQNHLDKDAWGYMAINSPFKGLRVYTRSSQGLLNQDEELNQLLSKVLGEEIMQGICMKIADDLIVGGDSKDQAIDNWESVLKKLSQANLKLSPGKVRIFPPETTIFGWIIKDGKIAPDPHRQLALSKTKYTDIETVSELRSWIGIYKTFLIAMPGLASVMDPFDKMVAGVKEKTSKIQWTPELIEKFDAANAKCKTDIQFLTLPRNDEQLVLMPDATLRNPAIGITLNVVRDQKLLPVIFYSFKLTDTQTNWWPCEREALAVATAIKKCAHFITESKMPLLILSDSKPVVEAFQLMKKGKFSTSSRMSAFLYSANQYKVDIQHISGKYKQNQGPDYLSRNPAQCNNKQCQVCLFILQTSQCVVSAMKVLPSPPVAIKDIQGSVQTNLFLKQGPLMLRTFTTQEVESAVPNNNPPIGNKTSWMNIQQEDFACREAHKRLVSGQQPNKKGPMSNDIRKYYNSCQAKDLLVVVDNIPNTTQVRQRIVVPKDFVPAIISQLHHREANHPSQYQLEKLFNKYYFGIHSKQVIADVSDQCILCKSNKYMAPLKTEYQAISKPEHPGCLFNIDVMKRNNQKVMVCRDLFSTYTTTAIVKSEQSNCLLKGIIECITPIRSSGQVTVRTDSAPGFLSIENNPVLSKLNIILNTTDSSNKNSVASVDNAIREIEEELIKLSPHDASVNPSILALATKSMNNKIRNRGLTAFEIMFARDSVNQQNLTLTDGNLIDQQLKLKEANNKHLMNSRFKNSHEQTETFQKGDTIALITDKDKTKARDIFMVTGVDKNKMQVNKIIKYHTPNPKIQSKSRIVPLPAAFKITSGPTKKYHSKDIYVESTPTDKSWSPYNDSSTKYDDYDDDSEENLQPDVHTAPENEYDDTERDYHIRSEEATNKQNPYDQLKSWENSQRIHASTSVNKSIISQEIRTLIDDLDTSYHELCSPPPIPRSQEDLEWDNFHTPGNSPEPIPPLMQVQTVENAFQQAMDEINAIDTNRPQRLEAVLPLPEVQTEQRKKKKKVSPLRDQLPLERLRPGIRSKSTGASKLGTSK